MAEVEAVNANLTQRIDHLERQLGTANATVAPEIILIAPDSPRDAVAPSDPSCDPEYWLNAETNTCEVAEDTGLPRCDEGYWYNEETDTCVKALDP